MSPWPLRIFFCAAALFACLVVGIVFSVFGVFWASVTVAVLAVIALAFLALGVVAVLREKWEGTKGHYAP